MSMRALFVYKGSVTLLLTVKLTLLLTVILLTVKLTLTNSSYICIYRSLKVWGEVASEGEFIKLSRAGTFVEFRAGPEPQP